MEVILQIIILLLIYSIYKNPKVGIPLFISYYFLVPYCKLNFGLFSLQNNFIYLLIFLAVVRKNKHINFKPFYAFFVYFILIFLTIPFTKDIGADYQFDALRASIMSTLLIPISIWGMLYGGYSFYNNTQKSLVITITIICIYGLFLTTTNGVNPYVMMFSSLKGLEYNAGYFTTDDRLFGRISSVFMHPMRFAMFLGCASIFLYSIKNKISKGVFYVLIVLIFANCLFCGVRSVLFALFITIMFFLLMCRKFKLVLGFISFSLFLLFLISLNSEISDYLLKVTGSLEGNSKIGGSSIELRLQQLESCFSEIQDCATFGKGFHWHQSYILQYGNHPVIKAFESLIFVILCDQGYFGFIIWGILIFLMYKTQKKFIRDRMSRLILSCYIVFYLSYCIFTGEYNYMIIFLIFYFFTFSMMYLNDKNSQNRSIQST